MKDSFYLEHIPQSEYRRRQKKRERPDSFVLDMDLSKFNIEDQKISKQLKKSIESGAIKLQKALLPEDKQDFSVLEGCLNKIYQSLGLNK